MPQTSSSSSSMSVLASTIFERIGLEAASTVFERIGLVAASVTSGLRLLLLLLLELLLLLLDLLREEARLDDRRRGSTRRPVVEALERLGLTASRGLSED